MREHADLADGLAVPCIGKHHVHLAVAPLLAPLPQREDDRQQSLPLRAERIDHAPSIPWIGGPLQDAAGDELRQSVRQDVAGNAEPSLELLEMLEAVERAAQDQERPFLA